MQRMKGDVNTALKKHLWTAAGPTGLVGGLEDKGEVVFVSSWYQEYSFPCQEATVDPTNISGGWFSFLSFDLCILIFKGFDM